MTRTLVRFAVLSVAGAIGAWTARALGAPAPLGAAAGVLAGAVTILLELGAAALPTDRLVPGAVGGLVGLGAGLVAGFAAEGLVPVGARDAARALGALLGAYLGAATALGRLGELAAAAGGRLGLADARPLDKVLDTSAIIDGRIADVCEAGFVDGNLVVPRFVLGELGRVADTADTVRRSRGRRGFEVLKRLQRLPRVTVEIDERDVAGTDVDQRVIELARIRAAAILTTDYNLNRLAEVHGVPVLNVNELADKLRPVVLPGESLRVQVLREGKEPGQGVAFLEDGTMVVVEQGKRALGQAIEVVVTSVLQTPGGRMIFARPREEAPVAHDG